MSPDRWLTAAGVPTSIRRIIPTSQEPFLLLATPLKLHLPRLFPEPSPPARVQSPKSMCHRRLSERPAITTFAPDLMEVSVLTTGATQITPCGIHRACVQT